jgi:3-deoxy-D-manno-octulosonic-acid transferase
MKLLYTAGIRLYAFILRIAASFHPKAKDWRDGRKNIWSSLPQTDKEVFWFHCASLGEFDQGLPVMNLLREKKPDAFILVTFFSPSGYNHYQKRQNPVDFACYIPIDTQKNAKRFVHHFQPTATFFIKYEFWSNHISELKKADGKLYSVSTLLRPSQRFFKWYGFFFRTTLKQFDYFFAQNKLTVNLLETIGINNVLLTGDTRFDRVIENKNSLIENESISHFIGKKNSVFIAGSTWPKDEEVLFELIHSNEFDKYIIVPHNVDEQHIGDLIGKIQVPVVRYSELNKKKTEEANVLIIDTIGQLASAYSYGTIAYVGGGFSGNLHNILEPAVFGLPVIFGPKFNRFPEAQAFIDSEIGFSITNSQELLNTIRHLRRNREIISAKSIQFVEQNRGASEKIIQKLF